MMFTVYLIGCFLSLLCNIYEVRKHGKFTVFDIIICTITTSLSFIFVIAILVCEIANNWDLIIWEKK